MNDLYSILKGQVEVIAIEAERLKREITEYRKRLAASDHPMKAVKLRQLQALLDRLRA